MPKKRMFQSDSSDDEVLGVVAGGASVPARLKAPVAASDIASGATEPAREVKVPLSLLHRNPYNEDAYDPELHWKEQVRLFFR